MSSAVIVISLVAPAISLAEPVILKFVAVAGLTVTLNELDVVIPDAVAEIDLGRNSFALYNTIGTLVATPLLNVTSVALPKAVLLTIGSLDPIGFDPLKVNDSEPV